MTSARPGRNSPLKRTKRVCQRLARLVLALSTVANPGCSPESDEVLDFLSAIMPMRIEGAQAAFEIVEVAKFVKADIREARASIVLTTLLLFATIVELVVIVTRRNHTRPIAALLAGARALGGGEHGYRVAVHHGDAGFTELAI